jgi:hypothetical protein
MKLFRNSKNNWNIEINQINVGTISNTEYASILRKCLTDRRLYLAQMMNILRVGLSIIGFFLKVIPLSFFWLIVALAVFSPDTIVMAFTELQKLNQDVIQVSVTRLMLVTIILNIITVLIQSAFGMSRFGFINHFGDAIDSGLRKHCNVVAAGSIVLVRSVD